MGISKKEKEKQSFDFRRSDDTVFSNGSFRDFLEQRVGAVMNSPRERMLEYENTFFGFLGAPSVKAMEKAGKVLEQATLEDLRRYTENPISIAGTGCYFVEEQGVGSGLIALAKKGDLFGFISIRDPNKSRGVYSLGRTSTANKKPLFRSYPHQDTILVDEKNVVDVMPGRMYVKCDGVDLQTLKIDNKDSQSFDISLKLTGPFRRCAGLRPRFGSRGVSDGETYHSDYVAGVMDWTDSDDPRHHYDLDVKVIGI